MKQLLNTLYVQTQGAYLRLEGETLKMEMPEEGPFQIPLHHLGSLVVFGNVLISPYLLHRCAEDGRTVVWLSRSGRFKGRLDGPVSGNVLLRRAQHQALCAGDVTLDLARRFVAGKLQNARHILMRAARESDHPNHQTALQSAAREHASIIQHLPRLNRLDEVRGAEGDAAKTYFGVFDHLILANKNSFVFQGRNRRPPKDPVNALLSFTYGLLRNECVSACEGVGLDPQMGFLHALRSGRPSLALDLMEELRSPLADRFVLTLINRQQIKPDDIVKRPGNSYSLNDDTRKALLSTYQKRKQDEVYHPTLNKSVPYGLIPHVQARLLARFLRGDVPCYQPFLLR